MSTTTTQHTQTAYKDTSIGKIPADWEVKRLGELGIFSKGKGILKDQVKEKGLPCIRYGEIYTSYDYVAQKFKSFIDEDVAKASKEINKGDVLFAGSGETVDEIGKSVAYLGELKAYAGGDVIVYSPNQDLVSSECLSYTLDLNSVRKQKRYMGQGNSVVHIYPSDLAKLQIPLPPLPEQKRIAEVLSTWDQAIQLTEQLIRQKEQRKKWLMQNLLTGKMRLKGFSGESQFRVLGKFITEVSDRNKNGEIKNVLSVTNSKGFINQAEQFEREVASADVSNYKIVRKGQFAYNPSRVNVGSLDLLRKFDIGILSPMYVVFETDQKNLIPEYLFYLLKTNWFYGHIPMFVQGSVRDSLSFDGLCGMKFFIPSIEEQTAIAEVLQTAEKEIELRKAKAEKLKEQKKGLMQQLLTGRVRLKINNE
jgi:type I restriction enzyme S subunit